MKIKAYALLCALGLFASAPVYAQGNGHHYGKGHGKGNPHSDKQGHDNNGSDKHDRDGDDDDDRSERRFGLLKTRVNDVVAALSIGTFTLADGAPVPLIAQGKLYVVMTNAMTAAEMPPALGTLASTGAAVSLDSPDATAASVARFVASFADAGAPSQVSFNLLTQDLAGLAFNPRQVPKVVADFNEFVKTASPAFLANPPAEFLALHAVLGRFVKGM
ncbi:MAG: hypothetical protein ACJ8AK_10720 [Gemmatimonadaceae bacterium]